MEFMYPQNHKVFSCQTMVDKLIKNFCKILRDFTLVAALQGYQKEVKNSLISNKHFLKSLITWILEMSEGK